MMRSLQLRVRAPQRSEKPGAAKALLPALSLAHNIISQSPHQTESPNPKKNTGLKAAPVFASALSSSIERKRLQVGDEVPQLSFLNLKWYSVNVVLRSWLPPSLERPTVDCRLEEIQYRRLGRWNDNFSSQKLLQ